MSVLHDLIETEYNLERLRELLRRGENPNTRDAEGRTPLRIITFRDNTNIEDNLQMARELINFGADVDIGDNRGNTPLHIAVLLRNYEMVKILLQANAQIDKKARNGFAALHYSTLNCIWGDTLYPTDVRIVKLLLKYNPNLDLRIPNRKTALMLAVIFNNLRIVQELLKNKASADLRDSDGNTALHYALAEQEVNVLIVRELMKHGYSYSCRNHAGNTPVSIYIHSLLNAPNAEAEKAKYVFKLIVFDGRHWDNEIYRLRRTKVEKRGKLSRFLEFCRSEITQMKLDLLAPHCSVFDLALRGYYRGLIENANHVPIYVYRKVLDKLIEGQYPAYCDLIVAGICFPYMNERFAELCCPIRNMGIKFLNYDILYYLSSYLSQFDMLNMMIACSAYWKLYSKRYRKHVRCSVS